MRPTWPLSILGVSHIGQCQSTNLVFTLLLAFIFPSSVTTENAVTHSTDCSANERLRCHVEEGLCSASPQSDDYASPPHDLRVSPYLISNPSRKPDSYQLWVNVTWRPPYQGDINKTQGFELTVLDKETNRNWCFKFILDEPKWEERDRHESTRFRFSTVDMFQYGHPYYFELQSLPKPFNRSGHHLGLEISTPGHPERTLMEQLSQSGYFEPAAPEETVINYCSSGMSHPHASRWIAAFRIVYIQLKLGWIYVEFIAAPPQYCFEEYELRLVDHVRNLIVQQEQVRREDLTHEMHDNISVSFGNHTFHNVTVGSYDIELLPVAHSRLDNRCLCPMANRVCTCSVSVWADVEMPAFPTGSTPTNPCDLLPPVKLPFDCPMKNVTDKGQTDTESGTDGIKVKWILLTCFIIVALVILSISLACLLCYYRRYKRKGAVRMYLLPMSQADGETTTNGTMSREMSSVLRPTKVTIIYSHDCHEFERTVRQLVDYLNTQCFCNVRIDYLCANDIAANKFDWAYKSILEADRVVLVNSYGAYMRYQAKLVNTEYTKGVTTVVERADPGPFDDLFILQLDLLSQECQKNSGVLKKFVSVRFPFTSEENVLPHANPSIRYELPKHFRSLIINLHQLPLLGGIEDDIENETSIPQQLKRVNKDDYLKCAEGDRLKESITAMTTFIHQRPNWFENLHVRRTLTNTVKNQRPFENGSVDSDRLLDSNRLSHPSQVPPSNQIDESSSPLIDHTNSSAKKTEYAFVLDGKPEETKHFDHSLDSGLADSTSKSNGGFYSPKNLKASKPNGVISNENDIRQRLIT